jgi:hypothetical protein
MLHGKQVLGIESTIEAVIVDSTKRWIKGMVENAG